jgi:DNA-binding transcriptional regulator PaaX
MVTPVGWRRVTAAQPESWVLLCYRLPREPSAPRITVWRHLKRLGVGQLADGLVTTPADARTREQCPQSKLAREKLSMSPFVHCVLSAMDGRRIVPAVSRASCSQLRKGTGSRGR